MSRKSIERNISYDSVRQLYYVNMDYGLDEEGRRVRTCHTFVSLAQARKALRQFETERDLSRQVLPRPMTLDHWLEYWMEEVIRPNRAETALYGYRKIIDNHLSPALGNIPLQKLTPQDIQKYYTMLMKQKGLSPNTVRRHHNLLSASLRMGVKQDILARCPTERVEPPRLIPFEAKFYGPDDLRRLCLLTEGTWLELVVSWPPVWGCAGRRSVA
ncbi:phage integrase SAM-like domain-containing protein [uncultured Intestinimonas sp.]|uniref:phage integrase SAM-like domain-containing protein n=1 Tax=uncultured Intestinimonas sp. TaxID=1689265 RepID=UPI0025D9A036|nr:phage integrase SAM-like domain-containing protein [uncultured Intestinimonas sp.]